MADDFSDDFMKDLTDALDGEEVPEGYEKCDGCGKFHPKPEFPKYDGPIIYDGNDAAYSDEHTTDILREADAVLDGALMDKIGSLMALTARALQVEPLKMAVNMQAVGALFLTVAAVSKFRKENPHHTREELIRVIRMNATDAHVRGQFANETLSRMMVGNPPPPSSGGPFE